MKQTCYAKHQKNRHPKKAKTMSEDFATRNVKLNIDTKTLTAEQTQFLASCAGASRAVYNWCVYTWREHRKNQYAHVEKAINALLEEQGITPTPEARKEWRQNHKAENDELYASYPHPTPNATTLSAAFTQGMKDPDFPFYWNRKMARTEGTKRQTRAIPTPITAAAFRDFGSALGKYSARNKTNAFELRKDGSPKGSPQFKRRGDRDAFGFSLSTDITVTGPHRLTLPFIGSIRVHNNLTRLARYLSDGGQFKTARFSKEGERWYVSLSIRLSPDAKTVQPRQNHSKKTFGGDLGINKLVAGSDGSLITQKYSAQQTAERIVRLQRKMSKYSSDRETIVLPNGAKTRRYKDERYARCHRELKRLSHKLHLQRASFIHEVTKMLTTRYGQLVFEDLRPSNMLKAPKPKPDPEREGHYLPNKASAHAGLARKISDASWGEMLRQLKYKAERNGSDFKKVNPAYTSRTCHECKHVNQGQLAQWEVYVCESCGHTNDRDVNAAMNILSLGMGAEVQEVMGE